MNHFRGRHYYMRKPSMFSGSSANNKHNNTYDKSLNAAAAAAAPVPPPPKPPSVPKGPYGWSSRNPFDDTD